MRPSAHFGQHYPPRPRTTAPGARSVSQALHMHGFPLQARTEEDHGSPRNGTRSSPAEAIWSVRVLKGSGYHTNLGYLACLRRIQSAYSGARNVMEVKGEDDAEDPAGYCHARWKALPRDECRPSRHWI